MCLCTFVEAVVKLTLGFSFTPYTRISSHHSPRNLIRTSSISVILVAVIGRGENTLLQVLLNRAALPQGYKHLSSTECGSSESRAFFLPRLLPCNGFTALGGMAWNKTRLRMTLESPQLQLMVWCRPILQEVLKTETAQPLTWQPAKSILCRRQTISPVY